MKDTKTQIVYNIIWSLISTSISLGVAFFMTPYITKTLGIESYGFIALGNQIISYINIVATAINSYAARYIGFQFHRGEIQKANGFYSSVLAANVALLLGIIYFWSLQIYSMALAHLLAFIYVLVGDYTQARQITPELDLKVARCSWQKVKILISAGVYNSINMLGGTLGSGLDLLVTNIYLTVVIMGQISVCQQIAMVVGSIIGLVANAFQPKELEAYARRDIKMLIKHLKFNMQLTGMIGNVFVICFGRGFF